MFFGKWGAERPAVAKPSVVEDVSVPEPSGGSLPETTPPAPEVAAPTPPPAKAKKPARQRAKKSDVDEAMLKTSHAHFYDELEKAAKVSDPYLLAAMILKYSEQIDDVDPEKSMELLSIAEGILNA